MIIGIETRIALSSWYLIWPIAFVENLVITVVIAETLAWVYKLVSSAFGRR